MKKSTPKARRPPQHVSKESAEPVVIHHADETVLLGWFRRAAEKGTGYWLAVGAAIVLTLGLVWFVFGMISGPAPGARAWVDLIVPAPQGNDSSSSATDGMPAPVRALVRIAETYPDTPAARWALLRAGTLLYEEGLRDLPQRREVARPKLYQAIEFFDRVLRSAPADAPEALEAAMAKARALESRGELDDAIGQYRQVASRWPKSKQAEHATRRAALLEQPETKKFYEDFYSLDFSVVPPPALGTTPERGSSIPIAPGASERFGIPVVPPLPEETIPGRGAEPPAPETDLPSDPFAPATPEEKREVPTANSPPTPSPADSSSAPQK